MASKHHLVISRLAAAVTIGLAASQAGAASSQPPPPLSLAI